MPSKKRNHLVDTALRLFAQDGFHATGIDTILAEAGVAKMTLYNHFKSKDELIVAALARYNDKAIAQMRATAEEATGNAEDKVLAIFDGFEDWFASPDFNGCLFINATAEYGDCDNPIHKECARHKRAVFDLYLSLARDAGVDDPRSTAQQLLLLREGAIVVAHVLDAPIAARQARRGAEMLLQQGA